MPAFAELLKSIPEVKDIKLSSEAMTLWVCGKAELDPNACRIITDYGGIMLGQSGGQSLWVFLSRDMFPALARLKTWADLNATPLFIEVFQAALLIGLDMELGVKIPTALANQNITLPAQCKAWIEASVIGQDKNIPGFKFTPLEALAGMASGPWLEMSADPRMLGYSNMGWYMVLKPLGNPLDKAFQSGWRLFFQQIELSLSRLKLKYILHDFFLSFKVENIQDLRQWCAEFLKLVIEAKEIGLKKTSAGETTGSEKKTYWPCVMALINSAGIPFSSDLPKRVPLNWEIMTSDFPHMSYRNALLLGPSFFINDARVSFEIKGIDDWCSISLASSGDRSGFAGVIPVELPRGLVIGPNQPCFYCGQRNHELTKCPSRDIENLAPQIWREIGQINMTTMKDGLRAIDLAIGRQGALPATQDLLKTDDIPGKLTRAIFEITSLFQFRMMTTIWRGRGRDYPSDLRNLLPVEDRSLFDCLEEIKSGNLLQAERDMQVYRDKHPGSIHLMTMQGFAALEKGDMEKAQSAWKDAERLSHTTLLQAYHIYLQGRCLEVTGKYQAAMNHYKTAHSRCRRWREALYRQCVCLTKMGFAEQSMQNFEEVIELDANIFNRLLIDPEMERGHIQLRGMLFQEWEMAKAKIDGTKENLEKFKNELSDWFDLKNSFSKAMLDKITLLSDMSQVTNFAAFRKITQSANELNHNLQNEVSEQISLLKEKFTAYLKRLQDLRAEAAWFPFPKALMDFNKNFNICARNSNWALQQDFLSADIFRKATALAAQSEEILGILEGKLSTLKLLRDSTLFLLILGKTFIWLEIIGLVCSLTLIPIGIYYGAELGADWAKILLVKQKWELQKGLIVILSIVALAFSIIYATMTFEKKRRALMSQEPQPKKKKEKKKKK